MEKELREYINSLTPFGRAVLIEVIKIPQGQTRSYRQIAEAVGKPRAYRAVGTVLSKNRFPIKIPCHCVIKSNGKIGKYSGKGRDKMKKRLLKKESFF
ncbi:MAG: MGMT family protein [Candidatus Auribacterota bacterium]|nr:MGMT family protein [Candidatus Auribacterota bacterium]